jgi:hypothetical protein
LSTVGSLALREEWPASRSRPRLALVSRSPHAPLTRKLDCLQLPVSDLAAGVAFYERLGHEVIWRRPNQVGLCLPETDAELVLQTERPDARVDLLVEDVGAAVERLSPRAVESWSIRFRSKSDCAPSSPTRMETSSSCST